MNNVFSAYNVNLLFCTGSLGVFWKMNVPERSCIPRLQIHACPSKLSYPQGLWNEMPTFPAIHPPRRR